MVNPSEKPIAFCGSTLKDLRSFPKAVKEDCGYQLHKVQNGDQPDDFRPMGIVGSGVTEIRVRDEAGVFRVMYTATFQETVYVLHAFQKKTQRTSRADIELARTRYAALVVQRRQRGLK